MKNIIILLTLLVSFSAFSQDSYSDPKDEIIRLQKQIIQLSKSTVATSEYVSFDEKDKCLAFSQNVLAAGNEKISFVIEGTCSYQRWTVNDNNYYFKLKTIIIH